ncbi:autophagy-related protein 9A [Aplysia californica]|uniref:Autophagy-related protein 9 n=1 Tax=Aplysia californica TaxID=6500 RepID=A0ABM1VXA1_APLCA|nr:autophagy-related protein 9A [Aplysia californica]XP_035827044.1 autophagy-related protein 9A [Aplysia californica]
MASDSEEIEYQSLDQRQNIPLLDREHSQHDEEEGSEINFHEEQGFMVHMSPDTNKSQWNHVDDLDKFFVNVYDYHQRHGFQNMVLSESLQLLQFVFIVTFMTYLGWCVNYPELFDEIPHNTTRKKTFDDITYPFGTCVSRFDFWTWLLLVLCCLFFIGRTIKMVVNFSNYLRTRNFFISALNIETRELSNMTWHEVQSRLLEVQKEEQICIHKQELTHLDIYHRILRFKNYLVAMVNKNLLPLKMRMPLVGEHALLTHGMRFNLDCLLYWSPWSIFLNSYTMREEYRSHHKRKQLAEQLSTHIAVLAVLNLVLCPFIFLYQIIYFFFRYTEFVKRSPSFLGSRQWANYGRLYLRHFNELDHELYARLNRAYIPSKMYMNSFTSASVTLVAKYVAFFAGAPAAVLFILGVLDFNDVTKVEHLFTVASVCGMLATICSSLIPDENEVYCPERLMMSILAQIHYMPDHWKGKAHTSTVRDEFSMLFQYKLMYILEELFSPLITPFWLFFGLRPKAMQIVDFFRCFTVDVAGVGDVCSFAQMDIKKHGNPQWANVKPKAEALSRSQQAENGKIELSLMHFTTTNPEWKPPQESNMFITEIKQDAQRELPMLTSMVADPISLPSLGYVNPVQTLAGLGGSQHQNFNYPAAPHSPLTSLPPKLRGGLSQLDGPVGSNSALAQSTLTTSGSFHTANFGLNVVDESQRELLYGSMSLSVLHIHEAHHRQRRAGRVFRQSSSDDNTPPPSAHLPDTSAGPPFSSHPVRPVFSSGVGQHGRLHQAGTAVGGREPYNYYPPPSGSGTDHVTSGTSSASLSSAGVHRDPPSGAFPRQQQQYSEVTGLRQGLPSSYQGGPPVLYGAADLSAEGPDFPLHPLGRHLYLDDSEPSSLPPLPLPPSISSSASSNAPLGPVPSATGRATAPTSDPMPLIKEDMSGEHEIDTSKP